MMQDIVSENHGKIAANVEEIEQNTALYANNRRKISPKYDEKFSQLYGS